MNRPLKRLRWLLGITIAVSGLLLVIVVVALGGRDLAMRWWFRWVLWVLGVKVRARGPVPGPGSLIVFNHISYMDIMVAATVAPGTFIGKDEITGWGFLGFLARLGKTLFVERDNSRRSHAILDEVAELLRKGERVLLFAEGGIVTKDLYPAPFKPMIFEACVKSGCPVVPSAFRYESRGGPEGFHWGDGSVFSHLRHHIFMMDEIRAELHFGEPLDPGMGRKALAKAAHAEVCRLIREGTGGTAPENAARPRCAP